VPEAFLGKLCAPNDPSPPALDTVAVHRCGDSPPLGCDILR